MVPKPSRASESAPRPTADRRHINLARSKARRQISKVVLDRMIEDATVDCHDEDEALMGIYTMIENELDVPFRTAVLGADVVVERVGFNDADGVVAFCRRGKALQRIALVDLPLPSPPPRGWEWILVLERWSRGR